MAKAKKAKPILTFRAKLSQRSRLYVTVRVFEFARDMRAFCKANAMDPRISFRKCRGACTAWTWTPIAPPVSDEVGIVTLCKKWLGVEVVSHECVHAALAGARRRGIRSIGTYAIGSDEAEELCYITGFLVRQIYNHLYASKVIV